MKTHPMWQYESTIGLGGTINMGIIEVKLAKTGQKHFKARVEGVGQNVHAVIFYLDAPTILDAGERVIEAISAAYGGDKSNVVQLIEIEDSQ